MASCDSDTNGLPDGVGDAVLAHVLYLLNISVLPVLGFLFLLLKYRKLRFIDNTFLHRHMRQAIGASVVAGIALILVSALIVVFGSVHSVYTWMSLILYFTCIHSIFIVMGVFAITTAQAGKDYTYPLFGRWV